MATAEAAAATAEAAPAPTERPIAEAGAQMSRRERKKCLARHG
jgi:hypothetical protein